VNVGMMECTRYLVTRRLVIHEDDEQEVVVHLPGDEIQVCDEIAAKVHAREPGALLEMDPRTEKDQGS
jgi:hypothetical protein